MRRIARGRVRWPRLLLPALGGMAILALLLARGAHPAPLAAPTLAGRLAYVVAGNVWLWQGAAHRLTSSGHDGSPALAPDGSRVAYVRYDDSFSDILVQPTAGGEPQFLTNNRPAAETGTKAYVDAALWVLNPAWAPDGKRLAYSADAGTDAPVLWIMSAAGENPHSLRTTPPNPPVERPQWAPDGSAIAATSLGSGKDEVWTLNLETLQWNEVAAPPDGAYDPAWSADGTRVAFAERTARSTDVWAGPTDRSAPPVQLTHLGRARAPVFSPDGTQLAFLAEKDDRFQVFVLDLQVANGTWRAGSPEQVTDVAAGVDAASGLSWSR